MHRYPKEKPSPGQIVIAYSQDKTHEWYKICSYQKVLTWTGRKMKFVNLMSKGFWDDNVVGWNPIPSKDMTI